MKTLKIYSLILLVFITGMFFTSCPDNNFGNMGTIVIKLPGGGSYDRAVMEGFDKNKYLNELKYNIVCEGPGPIIKRNAGAGETIPLYLTPGTWSVTITIINKNGRELARDTITEVVKAGMSKPVNFSFKLDEPYYFLTNTYEDDEKNERYEWTIDRHTINLGNYYTKKLVDGDNYLINIKGHSNTKIDSIEARFWLYTGDNLIDRDHDNMLRLGNSTKDSIINFEQDKDFDITFVVTANLNGSNTFKNLLNEPGRISLSLSCKFNDSQGEQNDIKAAITHFNMTVKETLSFEMVMVSHGSGSNWTSGWGGQYILVVPEYLNVIKNNTNYKITIRGYANTNLSGVNGQFQLGLGGGNNEATDWSNTYHDTTHIPKGDFNKILYVTTNDQISRGSQKNIFFNLTSNHSSNQSREPDGTVKARITNFSMTIEEVISGDNGLFYKLNEDGSGFTVRGSAATKGAVNIPDMWKETVGGQLLPVTEINDWAFSEYGITSVSIPNSVTIIGEGAFYKCTRLKSVTIPDSVTTIGRLAFVGCTSLINAIIGTGLTTIYHQVFWECTSLTSVDIHATTPPNIDRSANNYWGPFIIYANLYTNESTTRIPEIHVPAGSLNAYKEHLDWGKYYGDKYFYAIEATNTP